MAQVFGEAWLANLSNTAVKIVIGLIILIVGVKIVKFISKRLSALLAKSKLDNGISKILVNILDFLLYAVVIFLAAEKVGIPTASLITLLGTAGVAIGLALQGSLSNVASTVLILLMKPFAIGDYIIVAGNEGVVSNISLFYTTLITVDNKVITIPNSVVSGGVITDVTALEKRRVDVTVGIAYDADIDKAKEVMTKVYKDCDLIMDGEEITVFVADLGQSSVNIGGRGWCKTGDYWTALWAVQENVKKAFVENGIQIPFNTMTVHVDQK